MTGDIVGLIARLDRKPAVLVSGSAVGWYGLWQDQVLTESAKSHGCFSHELCDTWRTPRVPRPSMASGWPICASVLCWGPTVASSRAC